MGFAVVSIWAVSLHAGWTQGPSLQVPVMDNAAAVWGGYLYSFGGGDSGSLHVVQKISIQGGDQWELAQGNPSLPMSPFDGAVSWNRFFILSNTTGSQTRSLHIYDFYANAWTFRPLPVIVPDLYGVASVALNGLVWFAGGALEVGSGTQRTLFSYDYPDNAWIRKSDMHQARNLFCFFAAQNRLWVVGGQSYGQSLSSVEQYDPQTNLWTQDPSVFAPAPVTVWGAAGAELGGKFYVIGGVQDGMVTNEVLIYDIASNTWSEGESLIAGRYRTDAAASDTRIFLAGGSASQFTPSSMFQVYTASSFTSTPTPLAVTATPQPTSTSTQSTWTPSPTALPACDLRGVDLEISSNYFMPGMECFLTAYVCNTGVLLKSTPLFVILEAGGSYFFFPTWQSAMDFYEFDMRSGLTIVPILEPFFWPDIDGSAEGLRFYGAITDMTISTILGVFDVVEFGYGTGMTPTPSDTPWPTATFGIPTETPGSEPTSTPQPGARMNVLPGEDSGNIPGKGCSDDWIYCFELVPTGSQTDYNMVARVENTGTQNLVVEYRQISGDWAVFDLESSGATLLPGTFTDVRVRFSPDGIDDFEAVVSIEGSDTSTQSLVCIGRGTP